MSLSKEIALYRELVEDSLSVVYMPIVELSTGKCTAAEILLRYKNRKGEWVGPTKYIETLKELPIGNILLAWLMLKAKDLMSLKDLDFSFNCPGELLGTGIIGASVFHGELCTYASRLIVEITETGTINPKAREVLQFYKETYPTMRFAFDDTPRELDKRREDILEYIHLIKFASPKVIHKDPAHDKGIAVDYICEYIETKEDVQLALDKGVKYGQGWYFSPGLHKKEFIEYYVRNRKQLKAKRI